MIIPNCSPCSLFMAPIHIIAFQLVVSGPIVSDTSLDNAQLFCMQRFSIPENDDKTAQDYTPTYSRLMWYFTHKSSLKEDVCTWTGIECENGRMTSLHIPIIPRTRYTVDIDWLPATTRHIHVLYVTLFRIWTLSRLPRELIYMNLTACSTATDSRHSTIDFGLLPRKMEELFVFDCDLCGTLRIKAK